MRSVMPKHIIFRHVSHGLQQLASSHRNLHTYARRRNYMIEAARTDWLEAIECNNCVVVRRSGSLRLVQNDRPI
jgi:hypothetical protein